MCQRLTRYTAVSPICKGAMTVNCLRKKHMRLCKKHPAVLYHAFCALCAQDRQIKLKKEREAKEKAKREKEEVEKNSFFTNIVRRKKDKLKHSDPVSQPSMWNRQEHHILIIRHSQPVHNNS